MLPVVENKSVFFFVCFLFNAYTFCTKYICTKVSQRTVFAWTHLHCLFAQTHQPQLVITPLEGKIPQQQQDRSIIPQGHVLTLLSSWLKFLSLAAFQHSCPSSAFLHARTRSMLRVSHPSFHHSSSSLLSFPCSLSLDRIQ